MITILEFFLLFFAACWLAATVWVFNDARSRLADPWLIGVATTAAALFFVGGVIVYALARPTETIAEERERVLATRLVESVATRGCPGCDGHVLPEFAVCPHCGVRLKVPCPECERPSDLRWRYCATCAHPLRPHPPLPPAPVTRVRPPRRGVGEIRARALQQVRRLGDRSVAPQALRWARIQVTSRR